MRYLRFIAMMTTLAAMPANGADKLSISLSDVDSLKLSITLPQIILQLEQRIIYAKDLLRQRQWEIITAYYRLQTARQSLALLRVEVSNLWQLYELNRTLAKNGEIADRDLLLSHNAYLGKEASRIAFKAECQHLILDIARLASLNIEIGQEKPADDKKETTDTPAHRP